ncbi:AMP-binding protein [Spirulina sp. CS-785/01]|uniref:AMP-binding protein n=1 Tax=Spirulina sp. CS-785/01 TaxID=3021716 RepID=UPI00233123E4|nr:AMP-binding protein [Spirulina sp. CS-785/01]MDB9315587.1 AMP-binding protein [Spirulina sp. CS-785/01]
MKRVQLEDNSASVDRVASPAENRHTSLVEMVRDRVASQNENRACQSPDTLAYTFLKDGQYPGENLTLGELDTRARAIAAFLQAHCTVGDRVLLVYPQSIEAIVALLGCLYAGVVAVPAPAPETTRLKRVLPRLEAIAADAGAKLVLTATRVLQPKDGWQFVAQSQVRKLNGSPCLFLHYLLTAGSLTESSSHLAALPWIATGDIPNNLAHRWQTPILRGDTLAYLQYTSGSTSTPKGVMLDHDNLMGHLAALQKAGGYDSHSITVTWMPYFHDYGLVEGMLLPLYNGTPCYLMSPTAFIKRPLRWLAAISRYRATHSQAPNFAYAYCVRRIAPEDCTNLDLSGWQAAGNAAEPINPNVIDEFCAAFAGCGFQRAAFAPAYGLAEATLLVTTSRKGEHPVCDELPELSAGRRWVSCGQVLPGTRVEIVNPETGRRCGVNEVGEIWVASAGVARGYWQRQEETAATFEAVLADKGEGGFLRTGDLGVLRAGELFVTGRLKDLIIVRGENCYPQDIEWAVEQCHPRLRPDAGAAFAVETDGEERVVVVWECEAKAVRNLDTKAILAAVRSTVAEQFELPVQAVVLLKRGSIFKTSSGKIQRRACRQGFLEGRLAELARWEMGQDESVAVDIGAVEGNPWLVQVMELWRQVLGVARVRETDNFFELGGDSLKAMTVIAELEQLGIALEPSAFTEAPTLEAFTQLIHQTRWDFSSPRSLVPIHPQGTKTPLFLVHHIGGDVFCPLFTQHRDRDRPLYGLRAMGFDGQQAPFTRIEDMAAHYIREIQTVQPHGSYLLAGMCIGGNVALEIAQQLQRQGESVSLVVMFDSPNPCLTQQQRERHWQRWLTVGKQKKREIFSGYGLSPQKVETILKVMEANHQVWIHQVPQMYSGRVVFFSKMDNDLDGREHNFDPLRPKGWNDWVEGGVEMVKVPGRHGTYHNLPHVEVYAQKLNACLEVIESQPF